MSLSLTPHPTDASDAAVRTFVGSAHAIDLAAWLSRLPIDEAWRHLSRLDAHRQAMVFENLPLEFQVDLARQIPRDDLARIVAAMDADDRADLFNQLSRAEQDRLVRDLKPEDRDDIRRLSTHTEGCAGAIMTSDYATLDADMTAESAIAALRRQAPGKETIYPPTSSIAIIA
jgi:magnesium transporter